MNSSSIYTTGGTVQAGGGIYLPRRADDELLQLCRAGQFAYVLTPRQMGKSSLMVRTAQQLEKEDVISVIIDLTKIGTEVTAEQWYLGLLTEIDDALMLDTDIFAWWESQQKRKIGVTQRLTRFFEEVLLKEVHRQVVVFVDEIDTTLNLPFTDDFFAALRFFYVARAKVEALRRLSFVLIGVATPGDLIKDKQRTSFNIPGQAINLTGFDLEAAKPLAAGLQKRSEEPETVLQEILDWTAGQPFLTQRLCRLVAESKGWIGASEEATVVEYFVRSQVIDNWGDRDEALHFKTILDRLLSIEEQTGELLGIYKQVLQDKEIKVESSLAQSRLRLSGLVVEQEGRIKVQNQIYKEVFDVHWVEQSLRHLRPYGDTISAWLASGQHDNENLLQGEALTAALDWAATRSLSKQDYEFLVESQKLGLRDELQQVQMHLAERSSELGQVNNALISARRELGAVRRRTRWTSGIGVGLVSLAISGMVLAMKRASVARTEAGKQEEIARDATTTKERARQEASQLQALNQNLANRNQGLATQAQSLTKESQALVKAVEQSQAERDAAQADAVQAQSEVEDAQIQVTATRGELGNTQDKLNEQQIVLEETQADVEKAQALAEQSRRQAEQEKEAAQVARGDAQDAQQEAEKLEGKVKIQSRNLADIFHVIEGVVTLAQGRPEQAIEQFNEILTLNSHNTFALLARGETYLRMQPPQTREALKDFEAAIGADNRNPTAYFGKANTLMTLEPPQLQSAIEAYDQAIYYKPKYPQAWRNRGNAYVALNNVRKALESYNTAAKLGAQDIYAVVKPLFEQLLSENPEAKSKSIYLPNSGIFNNSMTEKEIEIYILEEGYNFISEKENIDLLMETIRLLLDQKPDDIEIVNYQKILLSRTSHAANSESADEKKIDSLLEIGQESFAKGKLVEALENYEKALALADNSTQRKLRALRGMGFVYFRQGDYQRALNLFQKEFEISEESGDKLALASSLFNLASIYQTLGQFSKSLEFNERSLVISRELSYLQGEAISLSNLASIYQTLGKFSKSLVLAQESIAISRKIDDRQGVAKSLSNIGSAYQSLGNYQQSLKFYQESLEILREIGSRGSEAISLSNIGSTYRLLGEYQQSLDFYQQSLAISRELGDRQSEAISLSNIGSTYQNLGESQTSLEFYQQSLAVSREIGDLQREAQSLSNLGSVYQSSGDFERSITFYQQSLAIFRTVGDRSGEARTLANLASVYASSVDVDKSIYFYQQSLTIFQEVGNRSGAARSLANIASIYQSFGNFQNSLEYYNQALRLTQEIGERQSEASILFRIGANFYEQKNLDKAIQFWEQSLQLNRQSLGTELAIATALYTTNPIRARQLTNQVLEKDSTLADTGTLRQNLWSDKLIADTQDMLTEFNLQD